MLHSSNCSNFLSNQETLAIFLVANLSLNKKNVRVFDPVTVNVNIFTGGKFRENSGKTFQVGVIFTIFTYLFSCGGNFYEEGHIAKKHENYPYAKISMFTVFYCCHTASFAVP